MKKKSTIALARSKRVPVNLLCGTALALTLGLPAAPAMAASGNAETSQVAQTEQRRFDIPSQSMARAVISFGEQSGMQVTVDSAALDGLTSAAVSGRMSPEDALRTMLGSSGIIWHFPDPKTVVLSEPSAAGGSTLLGPVTVQAEGENARGPVRGYVATRSATGTKTDTPLLETPQSISVVGRDQITSQGSQSVAQSVRYTPGVNDIWGEMDTRYDWTNVRGFRASRYIDGMRMSDGYYGYVWPKYETYGLERVEVLKGPGSVMYGQNPPGGMINLVAKRPGREPIREIEVQSGSFKRVQGAFDIGDVIDDEQKYAFRLTGLGRHTDTQTDHVEEDRRFFAPAFTFWPAEGTEITLLGNYQLDDSGIALQRLPAEGSLYNTDNGRIATERFLSDTNWDSFDRQYFMVGYEAEHEVSDGFRLRQNFRYGESNVDLKSLIVRPFNPWVDAGHTTVNRIAVHFDERAETIGLDTQAHLDLRTGEVEHKMLAGLDIRREDSDVVDRRATAGVPTLNIYNPTYGVSIPGTSLNLVGDQELLQYGVYLQDQLSYENWRLTLSGRYDLSDGSTATRRTTSYSVQTREDSAFTWRGGLSYVFDNGFTPFVSYATSFEPQTGVAADGSSFDPTEGEQYEIGIKYAPTGYDALITLSGYQFSQTNVLTDDPNNSGFNVQTGEVEVRGVELEARGAVTDNIEAIASYAFTESEVTKSNDPAELGNRKTMTPKHQASAWLTYNFDQGAMDGISLSGGMRLMSGMYGDTANKFRTPSTAQFDLGLNYDLAAVDRRFDGAELSINASNITNKRFTTCNGEYVCYYNQARTVLGTLRYKW